MLTATVISRRQQLAALDDERGVAFAKLIVIGKLTNQERLLRYFRQISQAGRIRTDLRAWTGWRIRSAT
jgi:CRISPR/Cas system-associated endonuclease Cas1